jgi:hypothetical protein
LPNWAATCKRGIKLTVDVGFPSISLPVQSTLWTGLTQQQSGIMYRSDRPLEPPIDKRGIPAQVPGSVAIAEDHGWIIRSLGFSRAEPAANPRVRARDADPVLWERQWEARALEAVASPTKLVFVHVLRVDTAGHRHGIGKKYRAAAAEADDILGRLLAADKGARWFLLTDHGHLPDGGHGGEEREVRQVQSCIAGPGVAVAKGELVHLVDVSRAIADSTGATLDKASRGRPISAALASPLMPDQAVPPMALGLGAAAIFVLVAGLGLLTWSVRRWWLAPWWFAAACLLLVAVRGVPTLSMPMIFADAGHDMYIVWLPALAMAIAATYFGLQRTKAWRVLLSQLAFPFAAMAAVITAAGAWGALFGADTAPVVPRYTAWLSPLILLAAHGAGAVAAGAAAVAIRPLPPRRQGRARTEPSGSRSRAATVPASQR